MESGLSGSGGFSQIIFKKIRRNPLYAPDPRSIAFILAYRLLVLGSDYHP
jgi:hypothetical protein